MNTGEIMEKIKKILDPNTDKEEAKKAIEEIIQILDDPQDQETGEVVEELTALKTMLELAEENEECLQTKPKISLKDDTKNQLKTGFITGIMSTIGATIGIITLRATLAQGNTAILDLLNYKTKTIAWILIFTLIAALMICLIKKKIMGQGKAIALMISAGGGIYAYAKQNKIGLLEEMELFTPLSAILWVWDEFDDFQDAYSRIKNKQEPPDPMDALELYLLPLILGMFGAWMGIDQYMIATRIPGRWGFAQYAIETTAPPPWGVVLKAFYEIAAFIFANIVASGVKGVGWILYTAASVIGSYIINMALGAIFQAIMST